MSVRKAISRGDSADRPLFVTTNSSSVTTTTLTITGNGNQTPVDTRVERCVSLQISGNFDGELTFEASNDQVSWVPVSISEVGGTNVATITGPLGSTKLFNYSAKACFFRVVMALNTTGSATLVLCSTSGDCPVSASGTELCNQALVDDLQIVAGNNPGEIVSLGSLFKEHTLQARLRGTNTFTSADLVIEGSVDGVNFVVIRSFESLTYSEVTSCLYQIDCDLALKFLRVSLNNVTAPTGTDILFLVRSNHSN